MSLSVISILALIVAIIIGAVRKSNIGILCIGLAAILGAVYGIKPGEIIKGFSTSLFLTMAGVSYLFAILMQNDTLTILAAKIVRLAGNRPILIYFMMFLSGVIISAVGPGAIPNMAIIPVLAVPIAKSAGLNPVLLSLAGQMGVQGGRMSPITPESVVVSQLLADQGLGITTNTIPMLYCLLLTEILIFLCSFAYFKGWQVDKKNAQNVELKELRFSKEQKVTLCGLFVMLFCVLVLKMNVGLVSFMAGSALIVLGYGYEKEVIKSLPWNVIFMVLGVGILMKILMLSGGVEFMSNGLSSIMTASTAASIMGIMGGIMSFFSSSLGVVIPTLVPTVSGIASNLPGADPLELAAMVVIGSTVTGFSPISTGGALIMSAVSSNYEGDDSASAREAIAKEQNKQFRDLFVVAFMALAVTVILSILGIYRLIL